jgi:hypothetical protein
MRSVLGRDIRNPGKVSVSDNLTQKVLKRLGGAKPTHYYFLLGRIVKEMSFTAVVPLHA